MQFEVNVMVPGLFESGVLSENTTSRWQIADI